MGLRLPVHINIRGNLKLVCVICISGILSLSRSCPHLQIVYLRRNVNVTDEAIIAISKGCPLLRELNVGGCVLLTDATLVALGYHSKCLKSLNISATQV